MNQRELIAIIKRAALDGQTELDLSGKDITAIPNEIENSTNLQLLQLSDNQITAIPSEIENLTNLQYLDLSNNQITAIPRAIENLTNLQYIDLSNNQITAIPSEIENLTNLQYLDLSNNQITAIPRAIENLTNLQRLYLRDNQITTIPRTIENLTNLTRLVLENNPINNLLPEIILRGSVNPQAIFDYLKEQATGNRPLHEAKVLFLGEAEVGKTSLIWQLRDGKTCDPISKKTEGINVTNWQINSTAVNGGGKDTSIDPIRLNLWDFGGQDIMHSTHQFFLTKRSLYILILNSRQNDRQNRIEYWLRIIQSFSDCSPIIIVCNHIDQHTPKIDEYRLRVDYPQIKNIVYTSCLTGSGIEQLKTDIAAQVTQLKHVYDIIPESYFIIKRSLEDLAIQRNYIPYEQYQELCDKNNLSEISSQENLIKLLHDLGTILNYKDDPRLSDTSVLNPRWVTEAVYKILNDPDLIKFANGQVSDDKLQIILNNHQVYPRVKYRFLTDLMRKFEICFPISNSPQIFLFPDLLSSTEPQTDFDWSDALRFRYTYPRVLPPSIISRFIVRTHRLIYNSLHWRKGVFLQNQNQNIALIRSNEEDRWIEIKVIGKSRRSSLLEIIRDHFDHIHTTLIGIEVEEEINVSKSNDIWENYRYLVELECEGETDWRPHGDAKRKYNIRHVLDGFELPESRQIRYDQSNQEIHHHYYQQSPKEMSHIIQNHSGSGDNIGGDKTINNNNNQNLIQVAQEIQDLIEQLAKTYPTDTRAEKNSFADKIIKQINTNPSLTNRLLSATKAGGVAAIEQFLSHPAVSFVVAALEDWKQMKQP
jgi:internalin A